MLIGPLNYALLAKLGKPGWGWLTIPLIIIGFTLIAWTVGFNLRGAEVIVIMSLTVPAAGWREWSLEATRIGAPLVLRGVTRGGLRATLKRIGTHLAEGGGTAIDPHMFRLFGIDAVPAVAVVPGGVPPCSRRGCSGDMPPPHDLVKGNVGLDAARRIVAAEGGPGRETARLHLEKLGGEHE